MAVVSVEDMMVETMEDMCLSIISGLSILPPPLHIYSEH